MEEDINKSSNRHSACNHLCLIKREVRFGRWVPDKADNILTTFEGQDIYFWRNKQLPGKKRTANHRMIGKNRFIKENWKQYMEIVECRTDTTNINANSQNTSSLRMCTNYKCWACMNFISSKFHVHVFDNAQCKAVSGRIYCKLHVSHGCLEAIFGKTSSQTSSSLLLSPSSSWWASERAHCTLT